jgi:hypothetical protein
MFLPDFKKLKPKGAAGKLVGWFPRAIHLFKHGISHQIRCSHESDECQKQADFDRGPTYLHSFKGMILPDTDHGDHPIQSGPYSRN